MRALNRKRCIKEFVQGWGRIYNYEDKIIVCLSKRDPQVV